VDGGHQGDTYELLDNGVPVGVGVTSSTPIDANHSCANDPTGAGTDPAACWNDPLMSRGTFPLSPGSHSLTIAWAQRVPGGISTLVWLEIGAAASITSKLSFVGSMPHLAAEGDWTTTFTLVNKGGTSTEALLSTDGDSGLPLLLPLSFPQTPASPLTAASVDRTMAANASLIVEASGPSNVAYVDGSAQLAASGLVDGFAIFHQISNSQEAVVPLETRNASSYVLAFDSTNSLVLGVAIENISSQAANVSVVVCNQAGTQIGTGAISLPANGHTSFVLSTQFPWTANMVGTATFVTPTGGQISVLGIRFTPPGTTTTVPALANVGTTGGSIAHIASANGWETTFVLVNTGASSAQANLAFFDNNGNPLLLPLTYTQAGVTASSVASSVNQSLAAQASLWIQSTGPITNALQTGSAQLITNGNVSGFVIFRYTSTGQEAVVPLESRVASAFLLAFDNTAGTATGVAVNNVSAQAVNIPMTIRDGTGAQIGVGSVPLPARGHSAFVLAAQFPVTAGILGTIEFDTPAGAGAQIGALGIRTPVAQTFTTLPALAK
jgi:hypothetical protein